jgi:tetratricopeptide (TPR) repeat protein
MRRTATTFGAFLFGASLAHAGPIEDCNQVRNLDRQLKGCTAYLKQGSGALQNLATAHLNRANIYAQRGSFTRAFHDYAAAISLDPRNPLAFYNRGNAYFYTRQYELAIADYARAIQIEPGFRLAYLNRGLAEERRGDNVAATEDYRHLLELDPADHAAQERLKRLWSQ